MAQIQHSTRELIETKNEKERLFLLKELKWLLTKALREVSDMEPRPLSEIIKSLQK